MKTNDMRRSFLASDIVLWLMNSSKQIQEAVGGYFKDPTGTAKQVGSDMVGSGENFIVAKDNMEELKEQLQRAIKDGPNFDKMKNHIDMTVTNEGLRIELTESEKGTFFDSGSAKIGSDGAELLKALVEELGKLPNTLAMEGHTDSKPYAAGSNHGNWELSADRANAVRRLMQLNGIREKQVTQVRGFADQRLRKKEDPLDAANRRISLIVQYMNRPDEKAAEKVVSGEKPPDNSTGKNSHAPPAVTEKVAPDAAAKAHPSAAEKRPQ
jgi:chemotaxis protein MotB